ncbi:PLDc N-terminal domain-containing protein [Akkermansiaceae bacterium]|nr:PLDc N-terminal domain-containing protein [Akkermansiaceae bacterium]MDB4143068.1 PLDc N-terminal domain-containing protein [Akkermansiaceae bacterium]MDB4387904.1 PLDc N-terminal domain-containing protein [Akkermansiaceae bacterium]MDC1206203.1 PLDc N-terminal domain-containing protein [Akkermansiaceae bacterium]
MGSIGTQEIIVIVIIGAILAVTFGLWLWSLIHCIQNKRLTDTNRIIGIVLIVLLSLLGSLIYLFLPRDAQPLGTLPPNDPRLPR